MNKYATHLPILQYIFKTVQIKTVFEYGCGLYSTRFFIDNAEKVESVEMQDEKWFQRIYNEIDSKKLTLSLMIGENDAIQYFKSLNKKYDLIFVDGIARENCIKESFHKSDIIVVHDTNRKTCRFYQKTILIPNTYKFINICKYKPATGIYTNNYNLFDCAEKI